MPSKKEIKITRAQATKDRARKSVKKFKGELRKALSTAILAAFGFLMALVWRDVITEWVNKISVHSPIQGKLISALIVTVICVGGVMVFTKLLSEEKKDE